MAEPLAHFITASAWHRLRRRGPSTPVGTPFAGPGLAAGRWS
ncbi:hypothetical protein [Candidatus Amarobacter glycogenicus]